MGDSHCISGVGGSDAVGLLTGSGVPHDPPGLTRNSLTSLPPSQLSPGFHLKALRFLFLLWCSWARRSMVAKMKSRSLNLN